MEFNIDDINSKIDQFLIGGKGGFKFIRVDNLAEKIGASEVGLRFIIGVFAGYPFAFLYLLLSKSTAERKHLYFTITGLLINYFCFGPDFVYNLFSIFITYISLALFGGTIQNVIFNFLFHTSYLTVGYMMNASSDGYDIKWTTPQCILCMRLIGLAWDVYDGQQDKEKLSSDQKETCVNRNPSFMEVFGFTYCFCGFLCGPQFSFQKYFKFVNNTLYPEESAKSRFIESLKRFIGACLVMAFFQAFDSGNRSDDLLTKAYENSPFFIKVFRMGVVYYIQFAKYVLVWWFSESVCTLVGLSYDGVSSKGTPKWVGLRNFKMRQFLFGAFLQDIIESFNINTNQWSGRYLFKRLRFLGNKSLSHFLTLLWLAIWHGFYIGYFLMFAMEFIQVIVEKNCCDTFRKMTGKSYKELSLPVRIPVQALGAVYKFLACGFYVQSFMLLRWKKIKIVYASVYYWPLVFMASWMLIVGPALRLMIKKPKKSSDEKSKAE